MRGLRFSVAGVPVHVDVTFLLLSVALAVQRLRDPPALAVWVGVVFVSILLHELGHAFAFRAFGHRPSITLYAMGGMTGSARREPLGPIRQLAVSLAGPLTGLALGLGAVAWLQGGGAVPGGALGVLALRDLAFVGIVWTIFNLLPVLPLDGGQSLQALLDLLTGGRGRRPTLVVSIVVGGLGALWALSAEQLWIAFLAGLFTWRNVQALGGARSAVDPDAGPRTRLRSGDEALGRQDWDAAAQTAAEVRGAARGDDLRAQAGQLLVAAHLGAGRIDAAAEALAQFPPELPAPTWLAERVMSAQRRRSG